MLKFLIWLNLRLSNSLYRIKPTERHKKMLLSDYRQYKDHGGKKILETAENLLIAESTTNT